MHISILLSDIKFADGTISAVAIVIIPWVGKTAPDNDAWLRMSTGLWAMPVAVFYHRQSFNVYIWWLHSPHERRVAVGIDALSCCPEINAVSVRILETPTQYCTWIYNSIQWMSSVLHINRYRLNGSDFLRRSITKDWLEILPNYVSG